MKHVIGIADMKISKEPSDVLVTYALGSCVGLYACDIKAGIGGILHFMMPEARVNMEKASVNPYMFADTGIPKFLESMDQAGACIDQLIIKIAGAANLYKKCGDMQYHIGEYNYQAIKTILGDKNLAITAENIGGEVTRTMYAEAGTGLVTLSISRELVEL